MPTKRELKAKPAQPSRPLSLRLSASEIRAEASYHVLQRLLARLPERDRRYIAARVRSDLIEAGLHEIEEEVDAMFGEAPASHEAR